MTRGVVKYESYEFSPEEFAFAPAHRNHGDAGIVRGRLDRGKQV